MDSNKACIVQFNLMYNYSQIIMNQNVYCLNYFKKNEKCLIATEKRLSQ